MTARGGKRVIIKGEGQSPIMEASFSQLPGHLGTFPNYCMYQSRTANQDWDPGSLLRLAHSCMLIQYHIYTNDGGQAILKVRYRSVSFQCTSADHQPWTIMSSGKLLPHILPASPGSTPWTHQAWRRRRFSEDAPMRPRCVESSPC